MRSERALRLALAEMYVEGVSTRKVAAITERLCGSEVSSTQVSRAATLLDEALELWRNRLLGTVICLYLDAMYEKVGRFEMRRACSLFIIDHYFFQFELLAIPCFCWPEHSL